MAVQCLQFIREYELLKMVCSPKMVGNPRKMVGNPGKMVGNPGKMVGNPGKMVRNLKKWLAIQEKWLAIWKNETQSGKEGNSVIFV